MLYTASGTLLARGHLHRRDGHWMATGKLLHSVSISANTTYIAAYFSTSGFAYDPGFFTNTGVDNAPLHALRSGVDGLNGVYVYGSAPQFPSFSSGNANYWADVVF